MKKILALILAAVLLLSFAACTQSAANRNTLQIVTTVFPVYDWVRNVLGENPANAQLSMLLDTGVDLHSYQPTADDILKISTCDLFIYVGGESDEKLEEALSEPANPNRVVINLLDVLGSAAKEEQLVEGMQAEAEAGEAEKDEHVWLSLRNAKIFVSAVSEALEKLDADHAQNYRANCDAYLEKLTALDAAYTAAVAAAPVHTLLFADRFPFRYLTDDYGLSYYAAFSGCSAETEASFETVTFLAAKLDELSLSAVMTIEGGDGKIAETVIGSTQNKNQKILTLNSMQSVTAKDVDAGASYLSIMENNLSVLQKALR